MHVAFLLNETPVQVEGAPPRRARFDRLRACELAGIEKHCKSGRRDAHHLMARDAQRHHAPNACKLFLAQHNGEAFGTVEGIADPDSSLHSEQYAQVDRLGPPCGFYWPSALVSGTTVPANGAVEHDDQLLRRLRHARPGCVFAAQALASLPLGQRSRGAGPESDTETAGDTAAAANNLGPPASSKAPLSTRKLNDHREMSALGVGLDSDGQEPPLIVTLNANLAPRHAQGRALPEDDQVQGSPGAGPTTPLGMTVEDVILRSITDRMTETNRRADRRKAMAIRLVQKRQTIGEIIHVEHGKSHSRIASDGSAESVVQRVEHSVSLSAKGVSVTQRHAWNRGAPRAQLTAGTQIRTSRQSLGRGFGQFRGCAVVLASGFWDASRLPAFGRPHANLRRISGGAEQPVAAGGFGDITCPMGDFPLGKAPDQIAIGVAKRPPAAGPPLRAATPSRQDTA